jgi:hypothetical protein
MLTLIRRFGLPLLVVGAVVLRLVVFFLFPDIFAFDQTGAIHGSGAYDIYAQNLIDTGVYGLTPGVPDAMIPPLYSYALMAVYSIAGRGSLQVAVFHTAIDALAMILLYAIAVRLVRSSVRTDAAAEITALLAVAAYAAYPYLIFQNLTLIDTPFFMLLLHAFVLACILLRDEPRFTLTTLTLAVAAGALLGVATLTRPILPLLALLLPLWFILRRGLWTTLVRLGVVAMVSFLVVAPWIARNQAVYGEFVFMSVTSGANFWQGNSPYTLPYLRAGYDVQWTSPDALTAADPNSPAADRERFALAIAWLSDNPALIPDLVWTKFLVHWSIDIAPRFNPTAGDAPRPDYQGDAIATMGEDGALNIGGLPPGDPVDLYSSSLFAQLGRLVHQVYFGGLLLLACIGLVISVRGWRDASLLWLIQIAMTAAYVLFHPSTRYRVPSDPLLFVLSALAVVVIAGWVWSSLTRPAYGAGARRPARAR